MEKRKSHNQLREIIYGSLGIVGVVANLFGIYFTHLLGIGFGLYVISMVKKDKENGLQPSLLGHILGWLGLLMGIGAIVYGTSANLQGL